VSEAEEWITKYGNPYNWNLNHLFF